MCHTFLASLQQIFQNPLDDFHTQWYFSCKSHCSCGLVWTFPQDVVVFILNTGTESGWLSPWDPPLQWGKVRKRIYRPATHPIHFAAVSPDKIHRCAAWAVFFFMRNVPWKFHKPTGRDTDFPSTPLRKQGQELRSEQTVTHIHEQSPATYFLRLNNSETFVDEAFWAQW